MIGLLCFNGGKVEALLLLRPLLDGAIASPNTGMLSACYKNHVLPGNGMLQCLIKWIQMIA